MGNKPSKRNKGASVHKKSAMVRKKPVKIPASPAEIANAIGCGYFTTDDQHHIDIERYAALYDNLDGIDFFTSCKTVLTRDIRKEYDPLESDPARTSWLSAIVVPSALVFIIQGRHVFIGNPWNRRKYHLRALNAYEWTVGETKKDTHDPSQLCDQFSKDGTKRGSLEELAEAYRSKTISGLVVDMTGVYFDILTRP